jgi:hypothetical protein
VARHQPNPPAEDSLVVVEPPMPRPASSSNSKNRGICKNIASSCCLFRMKLHKIIPYFSRHLFLREKNGEKDARMNPD